MLSLHGLRRSYGDLVALDGLSFEARPGRLLGFLGPNGAGKTTAMRSIFGLVEPDAGEVRWQGRPVDADVRRRFGYMPEQRGLYPKMACAAQLTYFGQVHGMQAAVGTAQRMIGEGVTVAHRVDGGVIPYRHAVEQAHAAGVGNQRGEFSLVEHAAPSGSKGRNGRPRPGSR